MALTQAEFDRLVAEHAPALYRTAYRLVGDRHDAEDLVQDTFRSAWKSRGGYEAGRSEKAWLTSILRRRIVDAWRRRTFPAVVGGDFSVDGQVDGPDPTAEEYTDEVQRALNRLPPELRESLLLVVVGELTHQEVADLLAIPIGTVLSRVSRARERLRDYLKAEGKSNVG